MKTKTIDQKTQINRRSAGVHYGFFSALFLACVLFFAVPSVVQLVQYYVYDPKINEAFSPDAGDQRETDLIGNFFQKQLFLDGNGLIRRLLGQREMNGVVRLKNGYLTDLNPEIDPAVLSQEADAVAHVRDVLSEYDIPFLYVMAPVKLDEASELAAAQGGDSILPAGESTYANRNMDRFLAELDARSVAVMDMREEIRHAGMSSYEIFYRTDHHWTTQGGLFAAGRVADWIRGAVGEPEMKLHTDSSEYHYTVYPGWHLGSNAQRTGTGYAGADDFTLITPDFDTDLTNLVSGQRGSFEEVLLDTTALDRKNLAESCYDKVFAHALEQYHNEMVNNDVRILLICDSFGAAMNPYLVLSFRDTECMSAYAPGLLTREYLERTQPDAVILMQYPGLNLGIESSFGFGL